MICALFWKAAVSISLNDGLGISHIVSGNSLRVSAALVIAGQSRRSLVLMADAGTCDIPERTRRRSWEADISPEK